MYEYGEIIPTIDYFIFRKCTASWKMDEQTTISLNLTYITEGEAEYTINNVNYCVRAGDLLYLPAGSVRSANSSLDNPMGCFSIDFLLINLNNETAALPFPVASHIGIRGDIVNLYRELSHAMLSKNPGYSIKVRALFLLILHRFFELTVYRVDSSAIDPRVNKVIRYISEHYHENISIKDLAGLVRLNHVYFGALFKREIGVSVKQYLARIRINHAENMLKSGEYTISETAERCGYNDVIYFRKQFKFIMGYPPSQCLPLM